MPEPKFDELFVDPIDADKDLANIAADARASAAYWQGRCEGLEITLGYLKDRLDRMERGEGPAPAAIGGGE